MDKRMKELNDDLEFERREGQKVKEKQSQQILNLYKRIDLLKEEVKNAESNRDNAIREQYRYILSIYS